jgi:hypothetical protein
MGTFGDFSHHWWGLQSPLMGTSVTTDGDFSHHWWGVTQTLTLFLTVFSFYIISGWKTPALFLWRVGSWRSCEDCGESVTWMSLGNLVTQRWRNDGGALLPGGRGARTTLRKRPPFQNPGERNHCYDVWDKNTLSHHPVSQLLGLRKFVGFQYPDQVDLDLFERLFLEFHIMFTPAGDFLLETPWRIIIPNPNVNSHSLSSW